MNNVVNERYVLKKSIGEIKLFEETNRITTEFYL